MRKLCARLIAVLLLCVTITGCTVTRDLSLKEAFANAKTAKSFAFSTKFTTSVIASQVSADDPANADYFAYANNSHANIDGKVYFTDETNLNGFAAVDIDYAFSKGAADLANVYSIHIDIKFNFSDLTRTDNPSMTLLLAFSGKFPQRILDKMPTEFQPGKGKYLMLPLSTNTTIKNYISKLIAGESPNWNDILAGLEWTRLTATQYKVIVGGGTEGGDANIKQLIDQTIKSAMLVPFSKEADARYTYIMDAIDLYNTTLDFTINNGYFEKQTYSGAAVVDIFTMLNKVWGRTSGKNIMLPLDFTFETTFSSWNAVPKFTFPTITLDNQGDFLAIVPYTDILPKFGAVETQKNKQITVYFGEKELEFSTSLPPIIYKDNILLPLKFVCESQGASISATETNGILSALLSKDGTQVVVTRDSNILMKEGVPIELVGNVGMAYDTFYAPLRVFEELLNMKQTTKIEPMQGTDMNKFTITFESK